MAKLRHRTRKARGKWGVVGISVLSLSIHAALVASASVMLRNERLASSVLDSTAEIDFEFSCWADAGLSMSAQAMLCTLPGKAAQDCKLRAWETFRFGLIVCDGLKDEPPDMADAVAFMSPAEIDAIEPTAMLDVPALDEIEAARLVEEEIEEKLQAAQERISNPKEAGQVIEVLAPSVEITPDKARFLSEYDTKVEKETVARGSTEEMVVAPAPRELPVEPEPLSDDAEPTGAPQEDELARLDSRREEGQDKGLAGKASKSPLLAMRAQEFREERKMGEEAGSDALAANGFTAAQGNAASSQGRREAQEGREEVGGQSGGRQSLPNLRPSEKTLSRLVGGGSVDRLDGVESGDFTALNSKKWKFASFFNRMKRQVAQNWHPDSVYMQRDPTGKVYGSKDRVTVLEISLKPNGALANVVVAQPSGIRFLDEEAIRAFQQAQPFPNPPSGLVNSGSQQITFSFGFQFQIGSRRDSWKLFRSN